MALLEVNALSKEFIAKKSKFFAVNNVSFKAEVGQVFGLLGPNGAGKTTTIRLLATTLQPTGGTAVVNGFDIKKNPEKVRASIGVLTTDIGLYDRFTGRENLRYFGELYGLFGQRLENRLEKLSKLLEMSEFLDKRAASYSTGMKQKVAIARSVVHDPPVVIFDEPTAGLDVLASQAVVKFIQSAKRLGKLVILSTHEMYDAQRLCDKVAIMHQGRIIENSDIPSILGKTGADNLEDAFLSIIKGKITTA